MKTEYQVIVGLGLLACAFVVWWLPLPRLSCLAVMPLFLLGGLRLISQTPFRNWLAWLPRRMRSSP